MNVHGPAAVHAVGGQVAVLEQRHQHEDLERRAAGAPDALGGDVVLLAGEAGAAHHRPHRAGARLDRHDRARGVARLARCPGRARSARARWACPRAPSRPARRCGDRWRACCARGIEGGVDAQAAAEHAVLALLAGGAEARVVEELLLHLLDEVVVRLGVELVDLGRQRAGARCSAASAGGEAADVDQPLEGDVPPLAARPPGGGSGRTRSGWRSSRRGRPTGRCRGRRRPCRSRSRRRPARRRRRCRGTRC